MLRNACRLLALSLALAATPAANAATPIWKLVAQSDVIIAATPATPTKALKAAAASDEHSYVDVPVGEVTVLKGAAPGVLVVSYHSQPSPFSPTPGALMRQSGAPSVLFLLRSDDTSPPKLYFAGSSPDAFVEAKPATIAAIRAEVARQKAFLAAWRPDRSAPRYAEVKRIVDRIAAVPRGRGYEQSQQAQETQQALFDQLVAMGPQTVPAIVSLMDDRRPLATPAISLENKSPNAFEGLRHYGPDLIVDALAAVLNQITGESFGFIYNGASDRERRAAVDGWRIYAAMPPARR